LNFERVIYHPAGRQLKRGTANEPGQNNCFTDCGESSNAWISLQIIAFPKKPVLTGVKSIFCSLDTVQKIKILDFPDNSDETLVLVKLDTATLNLMMSDTSFSLNPAGLTIGGHILMTTFTNRAGSSVDTQYFSVQAAVTPVVRLSSDFAQVNALSNPLTVTANAIQGGGTNPVYRFAKDRSFTQILQDQSSNNELIFSPRTLQLGINWIYVQLKTSENCYTFQDAYDSVSINYEPLEGISDPDFPGQLIGVNPNPFSNQISISGLNNTKTYSLTLYQENGRTIHSEQVMNRVAVDLNYPNLSSGIYLLSIYDMTKKRVLGSLKLVKK